MRHHILIAVALLALTAGTAHAGPLAAAATWFSGVLAGGGVAAALARIALGIGASLLSAAIQKKLMKGPEVNVQFETALGDNTPLTFVVGDYATAGKRKYIGSWGPNTRYITEVIEVSCLPQPGQPAIWVNDQPGDILWGETEVYNDRVRVGYNEPVPGFRFPLYEVRPVPLGHPLTNYEDKGRRIWVRWVDGSQTAADPMLLAAFGDDPDYPWTEAMIGAGKSYLVVTVRYDSDTLTSYPTFLIQPPPLPMYDPRLDSTAGGIGAHRWGNRSTYAPTRNNAVIAYNLARGIYYESEWVFGGRNLAAWRLPFAEWVTAMNACDDLVALSGGGTEPAFRCGLQVQCDMEPLSTLEEIGRTANMRFSEVGGMLKPVVGLPGASVFSISDEDIVITQGQSFRPFAPVQETFNALSATYPEPAEKWASKDAPEYVDADAMVADGGRYLPTAVTYAACPYARQVQRLMRAQMQDYRRMRLHQFQLPPSAYGLEPLDVLTWYSARNGYVGKAFVVESVVKLPGMCVPVTLREVDPADYDWSPEMQLPVQIVPPVIVPQWVLPVRDFSAVPETVTDADGQARRPAIRVSVAGSEVGVTDILIRIRKAGASDSEFELKLNYATPWSWMIVAGILPAMAYEVQVALLSEIGDVTWWSDWETVTTPDVRLIGSDFEQSVWDAIDEAAEDAAALAGITPVDTLPLEGGRLDQIVLKKPEMVLYRWTGTAWSTQIHAAPEPGSINIASFAASIRPVEIVGALPATGNAAGRTVFLTTDSKTYRWTGTAWTAAVPAVDVTGQLTDAQIAAVAAAKLTGQLTTAQIADGAITNAKIAALAASKITGQLTDAQIAAVAAAKLTGQLTTTQISDNAISTPKIAAGAVTANGIAAGAIVADKIAANAVTAVKIAAGAVEAAKIAAGAVVAEKIAAGAITASKLLITDGTNLITDPNFDDLSAWTFIGSGAGLSRLGDGWDVHGASSLLRMEKSAGQQAWATFLNIPVTPGDHFSFSVACRIVAGTGDLNAQVIAYDRLGTNLGNYQSSLNSTTSIQTVEGSLIVPENAATVIFRLRATQNVTDAHFGGPKMYRRATGELIVDGAITSTKIATAAVTANEIAAGAIVADKIASNAITAVKIAAGAVTAGKIAANAVTANEIAANAITTGKIAAGAVSATEIAAGAITAGKLVIRDFTNIVPNGDCSDPYVGTSTSDLWNNVANGTLTYRNDFPDKSDYSLFLQKTSAGLSANSIQKPYIPVEGGAKYYGAARFWTDHVGTPPGAGVIFRVLWYDENKAGLASPNQFVDVVANRPFSQTVVEEGREVTAPAAAKFARFQIYNHSSQTVTTNLFFGKLSLVRMSTGELIVDGAITTSKISAGAVEANSIAAGAIIASKIAAGAVTANEIATNAITAVKIAAGAITAVKLAAGAVTADKISVTDLSAISANLGSIQVGSANIGDLEVDTIKIKNGALSTFRNASGSGSIPAIGSPSTVTLTSITFTPSNPAGSMAVWISGTMSTGGAGAAAASVTFRLLWRGVVIATLTVSKLAGATPPTVNLPSFVVVDNIGSGPGTLVAEIVRVQNDSSANVLLMIGEFKK